MEQPLLVLGVLKLGSPLSLETVPLAQERSAESRKPTPWNESCRFITVSGKVLDTRGNSLDGAQIEVWHADHRIATE